MAGIGAKATARRLRKGGPTYIQRSRQVSSEEKALFHNVLGAGRSHVIREFFGLSEADQTAAASLVERAILVGLQGR